MYKADNFALGLVCSTRREMYLACDYYVIAQCYAVIFRSKKDKMYALHYK